MNLQRATLKRLDEAYRGFFRRVKSGGKPGFPRFRGKGWFDSFGFRQFVGITLVHARLRFKGMPGSLRVHWHRELPGSGIKAGARLIEVDPYDTSQECSGCGLRVVKALGDRWHDCPNCGLSLDRDLNAARNILNRAGVGPGLRNVAGCGMRAGENLGRALWACQGHGVKLSHYPGFWK